MNKTIIAAQLLVALLLSIFITRTSWILPVSPCIYAPGCIDSSGQVGKLTIQQQGFPVAYREITSFEPMNHHNYTIASQQTGQTSTTKTAITILIDAVFWYALFEVAIGRLVSGLRKRATNRHDSKQKR